MCTNACVSDSHITATRIYYSIITVCNDSVFIQETTTLLLQQVLNPLPNNTAGMTTTSPAASAAIGYRQVRIRGGENS